VICRVAQCAALIAPYGLANRTRKPIPNNLAAIKGALEAAGIEFTNGDVPGVRLRKKKRSS
jgi:hypothetical protein